MLFSFKLTLSKLQRRESHAVCLLLKASQRTNKLSGKAVNEALRSEAVLGL